MGSGTFPPSSLSLGQQQQKQHYHAILPENASEFFSNNIPAGLLFLLKILLIRSRPFANDRLTLTKEHQQLPNIPKQLPVLRGLLTELTVPSSEILIISCKFTLVHKLKLVAVWQSI